MALLPEGPKVRSQLPALVTKRSILVRTRSQLATGGTVAAEIQYVLADDRTAHTSAEVKRISMLNHAFGEKPGGWEEVNIKKAASRIKKEQLWRRAVRIDSQTTMR